MKNLLKFKPLPFWGESSCLITDKSHYLKQIRIDEIVNEAKQAFIDNFISQPLIHHKK